jgi:hypothetical protein
MGFLDNLENNLKSLESGEEAKAGAERDARARERERSEALAVAPFAEELKKGPFGELALKQAARVGHSLRTKIQVAWIGSTLRLEGRGRRLEFRPTPDGVVAAWLDGARETRVEPVDLASDPEDLIRAWMSEAHAG